MYRFNEWNEHFFRIKRLIHISYDYLFDCFRSLVHVGHKAFYLTIFLIGYIIKLRYIHSGNIKKLIKEFIPRATVFLMFLIHINYIVILNFAFSQIEEVNKIRKGFRIIRT
ncbi:hypothetical protein SDC9_86169 [bioreactor metagenome]|uniref:Uncharacterized protein n=1 Tax=bioreactor metagenome TaxID=1076179 RepID=A0A644ZF70_9ZZZZ